MFLRRLAAVLALALLTWPLLRQSAIRDRLHKAESIVEALIAFASVHAGMMMGFTGLMILGFLLDGFGYRPKPLICCMFILGSIWCFFYPSGWVLGLPLAIYALSKRLGFAPRIAA